MTSLTSHSPPGADTVAAVVIDFMFLDLTTCTRCVGTDQNLDAALEAVREVLEQTGTPVEVRKHLVATEEQAQQLRFVSSPTVRVNGRDIALELKESSCGSEACTDGCGDHVDCRVWIHEGEEYTEAPVGLIMDAVLRQVYAPPQVSAENAEPYHVPANLRRFFAGKAQAGAKTVDATGTPTVDRGPCCSAADQQTCCAPSEKAACCGASTAGGCGCQ